MAGRAHNSLAEIGSAVTENTLLPTSDRQVGHQRTLNSTEHAAYWTVENPRALNSIKCHGQKISWVNTLMKLKWQK